MNRIEFEEKVVAVFKALNEFLGYDFEAEQKEFEKTGRYIIRGDYGIKKAIFEINNFIDAMKYDHALSAFEDNLSSFLDVYPVRERSHILSQRHKDLFLYFEKIRAILELKQSYSESTVLLNEFLNRYRQLPFFTEDELQSDVFSADIKVYVERAVTKRLFKSYRYLESEDSLNLNDRILFYPQIGISEDIEAWLNFLSKQSDFMTANPDTIVATLFLKLDDIEPHFSSFLITLHKGKSIWVCTDQLSFANPYNKIAQAARGNASGKIARKKEDHYENIGLPYQLAWSMDKIRGEQIVKSDFYQKVDLKKEVEAKLTGKGYFWGRENFDEKFELLSNIALSELDKLRIYPNAKKIISTDSFNSKITGIVFKTNGRKVAHFNPEGNGMLTVYKRPEVYLFELEKLETSEKFYYVSLVERLLEDIYNTPPAKKLEIAAKYLETKMIGQQEFKPNDESGFEMYSEAVKQDVEELLEGSEVSEQGLALTKYEIVLSATEYDRNMLATREEIENHLRWNVLDEKRKTLQEKISSAKLNKKQDKEKLQKLFNERKEEVYKRVFMADHVYLLNYSPASGFTTNRKEYRKRQLSGRSKFEHNAVGNYRTSSFSENTFTIGKKQWDKDFCMSCESQYALRVIVVSIRNYRDFMFLLGITDRKQIPLYYRNYKAHNERQYTGNSILDNTHPYSRLFDPCSEQSPNGISLEIFMCNKCARKLWDKYRVGEKVLLDMAGNEIDFDSYSENYYSYKI